ncbi:MAG TPA: hypothetical protein VMV33_06190 [Rhodocyclaceae bacterium]|nr:hypothetical protein [Rhodocyclaceae bacterium]
MTDSTIAPSTLGRITATIGKALGRMTPTERAEIIASASADMAAHVAKAGEMLESGDDRSRIGIVEDLWDGAPDDRIRTQRTGGPNSSAAAGTAAVGSPQAASGDGAETMERQYSEPSPQRGVQRATEMLGRDLMSMRKAMKSFIGAFEAMGTQIEAIKAGAVSTAPDTAAIEAMIAAAVAKAMPAAKAEDEKKDEKKEDREEKADSAAIKAEMDEEGEEDEEREKEAAKSAALLRISAKALVVKARAALAKAREDEDEGDGEKAAERRERAKEHLEKAMACVVASKALRGDKAGPSTEGVLAAIGKAGKAASPADNQNKWPNRSESGAETPASKAAAEAAPSPPDLAKALDAIQKAASGFAMLQTDMKGLFETISGQSRGQQTLPPVFALAKAGADDLVSREAAILDMGRNGSIGIDDVDRARDVIGLTRSGAPAELIRPKLARLPEAVQAILNKAA